MFGIKERPMQDELPPTQKKRWLDEEPEMMEKIPPIEERVACCWLRRLKATPIRIVLIIIGILPILLFFEGGRHGWRYSSIHNGIFPIIEVSEAWKAGGVVFFFTIFALINFLGRNEKDHVDIYPEMMVFYDYDHDRKTYPLLLLERYCSIPQERTLSLALFQR